MCRELTHTCMCQYSVQPTELPASVARSAGGGPDWTPGGHRFESCPKDLSSSCMPYRATSLHRLTVPPHYTVLPCHLTTPSYRATSLHRLTVPPHYTVLPCHLTTPSYRAPLLHRLTAPPHYTVFPCCLSVLPFRAAFPHCLTILP